MRPHKVSKFDRTQRVSYFEHWYFSLPDSGIDSDANGVRQIELEQTDENEVV